MKRSKTIVPSRHTRNVRRMPVVSAVAITAAIIFCQSSAASAASSNISGWQDGNSTVFWSTARSNTNAKNYMRVSPYNGTNLGVPSLTAGARNSSAAVASFAKTSAMYAGGASYFALVSTGSTLIPSSTFYLTTSLGPAACGCSEALNWSATLYFDVPA